VRRFAVAIAFAAMLIGAGGASRAAAPEPVWGFVGTRVLYQQLARFDPGTLKPLPGRVPLAAHRSGWSFSPDRSTLVLGDDNQSCTGGATSLRFVDLDGMRMLGDVPLASNGPVAASAWLGPSRVLAVVRAGDCIGQTQTVVAAVDAQARSVIRSSSLPGDVLEVAAGGGRLVLLLAPLHRVGTARLAVVDADGTARVVALTQIRAGARSGYPKGSFVPSAQVVHPGLAVDPASDRAFVTPAGDLVAEIDLATLAVRYHETHERRSLLARIHHWLDAPAAAKGEDGPTRQALWLGNGTLAVTGYDMSTSNDAGTLTDASTAAGLRLVDTRTWRYRKLDSGVARIRLAGSVLVATGSSYRWDGKQSTVSGPGVIGYARDGSRLYGELDGESTQFDSAGGRGFVTVNGIRSSQTFAFDPHTGKTGRTTGRSTWSLLTDDPPL
jgi:hypothetical protein